MSLEERVEACLRYPGKRERFLQLLNDIPDPASFKIACCDYGLVYWAAFNNWWDVVLLLCVQYRCVPTDSETDPHGSTVLHRACNCQNYDMVKFLTGRCFMDPLKANDNGETPLDWSRGKTREYLESVVADSKKARFHSVVQYLKQLVSSQIEVEVALAEAMAEGEGDLLQSNVVLHGPPGAGKSSLKGLILGLLPIHKCKRSATNIIDKCVRTVCTDRIATTGHDHHFEIVENEQMVGRLAGEVTIRQQEESESTCMFSPTLTALEPSTHKLLRDLSLENKAYESLGISRNSWGEDSKNPSTSFVATTRAIRENLLKGSKSSRRMFNCHWHHFIDSGGQPQFLEALPLMYNKPSHSVVVMNLTEGLDNHPRVKYYYQGKDIYNLDDRLVLTNREIIVRMCQIAQRVAHATNGKFVPRVIVVGTHLDKLKRSRHLKTINEELEILYQKFGDVMVCKSAHEFIFPVNALAKGKERAKYTEELQRIIISATEESSKPVKVPIKWFTFHLELDKGDGVVKMSQCREVGEKMGLSGDTVHNALLFLNSAALVLYYPDEVPDLVLTKMDPFTNRLSCLIKASFIPPKNESKESTELRVKGVFRKSFLDRIFDDGLFKDALSVDEFLKLLEKLKIAVCIKEDQYFLPSALSLEPSLVHKEEAGLFKNRTIPLGLLWNDLILPHGFFLTIAVEMLQKSVDYTLELRTDISQWRGEIQMSEVTRNISGVVKLTDRQTWIQVSYSGDPSYCPIVYRLVTKAIERTVERFQHTGIESPTLGCLCPLCEASDHSGFLTKDKRFVTCSRKSTKEGNVAQEIKQWLQEPVELLEAEHDVANTDQPSSLDIPSLVDERTLTANDQNLLAVLRSIHEMTDWYTLGLSLGLPSCELERFKRDGFDEMERQRKMVSLWLHTGTASLKNLVQALCDPLVDRRDIANMICIGIATKEWNFTETVK